MPRARRIAVYQSSGGGGGGGPPPTPGAITVGPDFGADSGNTGITCPVTAGPTAVSDTDFAVALSSTATTDITDLDFDSALPALTSALDLPEIDYSAALDTTATLDITDTDFATDLTGTATTDITDLDFDTDLSMTATLGGQVLAGPFYIDEATAATATAATSLTINKPTGTIEDDLMVAYIARTNGDLSTAPSGWTLIANTTAGTPAATIQTWYKVAGASEPSSYTWTGIATAIEAFGAIHTFRGANTTTPIDANVGATGSATDPVAASVTTTQINCALLICCHQRNVTNESFTPPSGYTERTDGDVPTAGGDATSCDDAQSAAGATGTKTLNSTAIVASNYAVEHIAIAPGAIPF